MKRISEAVRLLLTAMVFLQAGCGTLIAAEGEDTVIAPDDVNQFVNALAIAQVGSGFTHIQLGSGTFYLPEPTLDNAAALLPDIKAGQVFISGADLDSSGNPTTILQPLVNAFTDGARRAFVVRDGGVLRLSNVQLQGFSDDSSQTCGEEADFGGGVICNEGSLLVSSSVFEQNLASDNGGAIYNSGYTSLIRSVFRENLAISEGGALFNSLNGIAQVRSSLFVGNRGDEHGGAIENHGELDLLASTLTGNANLKRATGAGLNNRSTGTANLEFVTIYQNSGMGVVNLAGGQLNIKRSILANNYAVEAGPTHHNCLGVISSGGHNYFGAAPSVNQNTVGSALEDCSISLLATDINDPSDGVIDSSTPGLAPLTTGFHTGLARATHKPVSPQFVAAEVPADICESVPFDPELLDQRGFARNGNCSIGAHELDGGPVCHGLWATIVGTPSQETLLGTTGVDVIHGLGGNDKIYGNTGIDYICGGNGNDRMVGGAEDDVLYGGEGFDLCYGHSDSAAGLLEFGCKDSPN